MTAQTVGLSVRLATLTTLGQVAALGGAPLCAYLVVAVFSTR